MKASDLFVRCLEAEGVERTYGVPGEETPISCSRLKIPPSSSF